MKETKKGFQNPKNHAAISVLKLILNLSELSNSLFAEPKEK